MGSGDIVGEEVLVKYMDQYEEKAVWERGQGQGGEGEEEEGGAGGGEAPRGPGGVLARE